MKNFKIILLTLLLTVGFIIPSCKKNGFDCGCKSSEPAHIDIQGISLLNLNQQGHFLDDETEAFLWQYRLGLRYQVDYIAQDEPKWDFSFSTIPTANACSCLEKGWEGSYEKLQDLSITTLNDFDADHPANSDITDLFLITDSYPDDGKEIDDFILEQTDFLKGWQLLLELKKAPELDENLLVEVVMTLDNGEEYTETSSSIVIK